MEKPRTFSKGEWIVHHYYGVGQIKGIEKKVLDGEKLSYYKVKTRNSQYWIPVDGEDNSRLRPLSSPAEIKKISRVLIRKPDEMDPDHMQRKRLIKEVQAEGSLKDMARIIRDLSARQKEKKLNPTEEDALKRFKDRLVREWAVSMEMDIDQATIEFDANLDKSLAKVPS
jgi:CarD family transcriptional regulator